MQYNMGATRWNNHLDTLNGAPHISAASFEASTKVDVRSSALAQRKIFAAPEIMESMKRIHQTCMHAIRPSTDLTLFRASLDRWVEAALPHVDCRGRSLTLDDCLPRSHLNPPRVVCACCSRARV